MTEPMHSNCNVLGHKRQVHSADQPLTPVTWFRWARLVTGDLALLQQNFGLEPGNKKREAIQRIAENSVQLHSTHVSIQHVTVQPLAQNLSLPESCLHCVA